MPLTRCEHEQLYGSKFFRLPNVLVDNMAALDLAPVDLTILAIFLRHRYRRDSEIRPSYGSIERRTGLSRRTIGVRVRRLRDELGYIDWEQRGRIRLYSLDGLERRLLRLQETPPTDADIAPVTGAVSAHKEDNCSYGAKEDDLALRAKEEDNVRLSSAKARLERWPERCPNCSTDPWTPKCAECRDAAGVVIDAAKANGRAAA
ncbi:MAG TPA: Lrp/AsnC family transcriptional regulator [Thermoleophilaceae bacterium]|nr:Lrp/AsnC family transcriptional regulator [Thermoleophilaceae bacterium]